MTYYILDIHDNKKQRFIVRGGNSEDAARPLITKGKKRMAHTIQAICGSSLLIDYLNNKEKYVLQEGRGTHKAIENKLKMINTCFDTIVIFGDEGRTCEYLTLEV